MSPGFETGGIRLKAMRSKAIDAVWDLVSKLRAIGALSSFLASRPGLGGFLPQVKTGKCDKRAQVSFRLHES